MGCSSSTAAVRRSDSFHSMEVNSKTKNSASTNNPANEITGPAVGAGRDASGTGVSFSFHVEPQCTEPMHKEGKVSQISGQKNSPLDNSSSLNGARGPEKEQIMSKSQKSSQVSKSDSCSEMAGNSTLNSLEMNLVSVARSAEGNTVANSQQVVGAIDEDKYLEPEKVDDRKREDFFLPRDSASSPPIVPLSGVDDDADTFLEPEEVDVRKKEDFFGARPHEADSSPPIQALDAHASHSNQVKVTSLTELDGVDWEKTVKQRRNNLKRGSMPNVHSMPAEVKPPTTVSFMRTASSAEDDTVGAIRTRIMNATFLRRKSTESAANSFASKAHGIRRMSMPHMSMSMPAKAMKQVSCG